MRWQRNLRLSLRALGRSRLRTGLSISGIAIGIASVVVLIGAGVGADQALRQALEPLGHNLLVVNPARTETGALRGSSRVSDTLRVGDWQALEAAVPGLLRTAPVAESPLLARAEGSTVSVRVHGTTPAFEQARSFPLVAGRFIDEDDLRDTSRVAVVGAVVVEELFQGESPLGEVVHLGDVPFRIVGVTRKKGVVDGANEDEVVIVPLTTAMRRLVYVDYLSRIYVQARSEAAIPAARQAITTLLRKRHSISSGRPDDFGIQDQTAIVRARRRLGGSLSRSVMGLSILALGLGGVGLLAVSLLSVRERRTEIGVRLAVGARSRDIGLQFLLEAALLSLLGGLAGLTCGGAGILLGSALTRWPMVLAWQAVVYPLVLSAGIAVVFGAWPAVRAARLDPILALEGK